MQFLLPLASLLGIEVGELLDRVKKNAVAWSAVAFFGMIAVVFVLVAINNGATLAWGPVAGPLLVALLALIVAVGIWASMAIAHGAARRREASRRRSSEKTALVTTAAVSALPLVLRSPLLRKVGLPLGALAAAFLLSKSGRSRAADE